MDKLTHIDKNNQPAIVDVTNKPVSCRVAEAEGFIHLQKETLKLICENRIKKGNVITTAELAGIQAAKQTPFLIPLCHTLMLSQINVEGSIEENGIRMKSVVKCVGQTGVEMEALTAVSTALMTVYDMCKAVDKNMVISGIKLLLKRKNP